MMLRQLQNEYQRWLEDAGKAHATVIAYVKDVEQFVTFLGRAGKTTPTQVQSEDFVAYRQELETLRYTDKSVSRKLNSLKSFFRYLKQQGHIQDDPVQSVEYPKYEVAPPRILSRMEYRALRDASKHDARMNSIIEVLLQTGIRISELAALTVDDISLPKSELLIRPHSSHPMRTVPLNKAAKDAIVAYSKVRPRAKERTFFLTKSCRPFLVRNIRSAIDRYCRLAGIQGAKVNDLRHTFIVEQLSAGVPLLTVSKIVGHKRLSTTERYLRFLDPATMSTDVTIQEL